MRSLSAASKGKSLSSSAKSKSSFSASRDEEVGIEEEEEEEADLFGVGRLSTLPTALFRRFVGLRIDSGVEGMAAAAVAEGAGEF
jgi:hypothetical protein